MDNFTPTDAIALQRGNDGYGDGMWGETEPGGCLFYLPCSLVAEMAGASAAAMELFREL